MQGDVAPYAAMPADDRRPARFARDRDAVLACDVFLFVTDGRVPDEGAAVELGIAYADREANGHDRLLVGLRTDVRAAFRSAGLNPMIRQALDTVVGSTPELLDLLRQHLDGGGRLIALQARLGVEVPGPGPSAFQLVSEREQPGYREQRVVYTAPDGDRIPAFLLRPEGGGDEPAGVVCFHQHNSEWHLGKSEPAGLAGDPLQAFGPPLARAGAFVLLPDAVTFEDRRRRTTGTELHADDRQQHHNEMTYRLVSGDTVARKNLQDAILAVNVLLEIGANPSRVGAMGHSFGGHTTLFLAAVDDRVSYACVSGPLGSYRARMAADVGIGHDQLWPGIARDLDFEALVRTVAPRRLLVVAGKDDKYASHAREVVDAARDAFTAAPDALELAVMDGGHALTRERHQHIVSWMTAQATGV